MDNLTEGLIKSILLVLLLALSACAISPTNRVGPRLPTDAEVEQYNASVAPDERIVCRRETPTGSKIRRRNCRMIRDVEEISAFHRDELRRVLR